MSRQVILIRHGISEKSGTLLGQCDAELTSAGRSQAVDLARRLAGLGVDRLLSSPLRRALGTAEPSALQLGLEIETDSRLREISYGPWDGHTWEEIERAEPQAALLKRENWWEITPAGGESFTQFYCRVSGAWRDLLAHPARLPAVAAHHGVNAVLFDLANHPSQLENEGEQPDWLRIARFEQAPGTFLVLSLASQARLFAPNPSLPGTGHEAPPRHSSRADLPTDKRITDQPPVMDLLTQTIREIEPAENPELATAIKSRLDRLTKPRGSLGRLEDLAVQYGLARGVGEFALPRKCIFVFCADHGIAAEGVSAYPAEVTQQMVRNFVAGGAAINVLCRQHKVDPVIIDMGVNQDFDSECSVVNRKVAYGTRSFLHEPAMTRAQAVRALETGISLAKAAARMEYDLLAAGEMGIGNTTSASAITAAMTGRPPIEVTGAGTGINEEQRRRKASLVSEALQLQQPDPADPVGVLARLGGFEIAGIAGFVLGAAASRLATVVDGFIVSAAALLAVRLAPAAAGYLIFSHRSAEPGHQAVLDALGADPILSLNMRLGEGTGAVLAMSLIESAIRLYNEMATFDSAGVSEKPG